jgi:hypothetical protein
MIPISIACYLLFCHFISDFVFQTEGIGESKAHSLTALVTHIFILVSVLLAMTVPLGISPWYALVNGSTHFVIDFFTSKGSHYYYKQKRHYAFWKVISIDQMLHTSILIITYPYFI